jgi:transglutaminase-like putative cysteine protease
MRRHALLLFCLAALAVAPPAGAYAPILHERIPPDPQEDLALSISLDGDMPAAMNTPSGLVRAPDPRKPVTRDDPTSSRDTQDTTFRPDRDTRRPDVLPYDDPFVPSTAPFKRLIAYDTVLADFSLAVADDRLVPLSTHAVAMADGSDEQFYANMVLDLVPGRKVRIPSVGPGARIVHARAGIEAQEVPLRISRDGAENWFADSDYAGRARLVMQLTVPRAVFGGEFADAPWEGLAAVAPMPRNVMASAADVSKKLGVSRAMRPREVVAKLVSYFRSFADSEEPPRGGRDIYTDLALSKKGVCRHRAFAFLVTARYLGIPTRMIVNEAHAWVEVHDTVLWRRIDLGGAGRTLGGQVQSTVAHDPPPDPFAWPPNSTRGEDLADRTRRQGAPGQAGGSGSGSGSSTGGGASPGSSASPAGSGNAGAKPSGSSSALPTPQIEKPGSEKDERPTSTVQLASVDTDARRGAPLHVAGNVLADGEPCAHVPVEIVLRDARKGHLVPIGTIATDAKGAYSGALVIPAGVPLGDYDVFAQTAGDARCGKGGGP